MPRSEFRLDDLEVLAFSLVFELDLELLAEPLFIQSVKKSEIYKVKAVSAQGPTLIKMVPIFVHSTFNAFRELELFFFVTFTSFSEALLFCSCCFRESGMMKTESGISSVVASFVSLAASSRVFSKF